MFRAWNGKRKLNDMREAMTNEQRALVYIVNSLEDFKRELVPTSTMAGEINRIQQIALGSLHRAEKCLEDINNEGCGNYSLKDFKE